MSDNVVQRFYEAFARKDWKAMQECYHPEVTFSDPVFPELQGKQALAMWHMLALAGKDLIITFRDAQANATSGSCHWEATYSFSRTGRKVHNVIDATFTLSEGKIIRHRDNFDLWKWAGMALGLTGRLLGWTSFVQDKVKKTAASALKKFISEHPEYGNG